jgi:hypothetical protein
MISLAFCKVSLPPCFEASLTRKGEHQGYFVTIPPAKIGVAKMKIVTRQPLVNERTRSDHGTGSGLGRNKPFDANCLSSRRFFCAGWQTKSIRRR